MVNIDVRKDISFRVFASSSFCGTHFHMYMWPHMYVMLYTILGSYIFILYNFICFLERIVAGTT